MRLTFLAVSALFAASAAAAQDCSSVTVGDLTVTQAWARATIGADRPAVLYLMIRNDGAADDQLEALATPTATMPMLHQTVVENGVAQMPHAEHVLVPAGGTLALEPGGYHGMLMGLVEALEAGDTFPVTLAFQSGTKVTVEVQVLPLPSQGPEC